MVPEQKATWYLIVATACILVIRMDFTLSNSKKLVFFGQKGLLLFEPDEIKTNNIVPPLVLTDIKIFNIDAGVSSKINQGIKITETGRDEGQFCF